MKSDRFWETFWLSFFGIAFLAVFASTAMFVVHIRSLNAAAVGVTFDPEKDPFEGAVRHGNLALTEGYAYRNALPLGMSQWAWDAQLNWNSREESFEGGTSLKMSFLAPWAGMGMNGFSVPRSSHQSISLAVYPDDSVGDLYIELYDAGGNTMVRQSIGWYAPSATLIPNQWQYVSIPLSNLLGSSGTRTITGLAISTKNAGVAYADSIQFTGPVAAHDIWVQPVGVDAPPFNPFATSTPSTLPYIATFSPSDFSRWFSYYGLFAQGGTSFEIGPQPGGNSDSVAVYRGGRFWTDYKAKATLDWGITSVFSLLVRFADPANFASCAFSYYGQTVQIFSVKNGVSTQLGQTPALAIGYDAPWQNVQVAAQVQGHTVTCFVNGERALSATIDDISPNGTLGLEAWDQSSNSSAHTLHSLEVQPLLGE